MTSGPPVNVNYSPHPIETRSSRRPVKPQEFQPSQYQYAAQSAEKNAESPQGIPYSTAGTRRIHLDGEWVISEHCPRLVDLMGFQDRKYFSFLQFFRSAATPQLDSFSLARHVISSEYSGHQASRSSGREESASLASVQVAW